MYTSLIYQTSPLWGSHRQVKEALTCAYSCLWTWLHWMRHTYEETQDLQHHIHQHFKNVSAYCTSYIIQRCCSLINILLSDGDAVFFRWRSFVLPEGEAIGVSRRIGDVTPKAVPLVGRGWAGLSPPPALSKSGCWSGVLVRRVRRENTPRRASHWK